MYVVRYQHGTLTSERMGSQRADQTFGTMLQVLTGGPHRAASPQAASEYTLVRYSPHNAWYTCDRPSHVARFASECVPCVVIAIQQDRGTIPANWPVACPKCGHLYDTTNGKCLCACHIA